MSNPTNESRRVDINRTIISGNLVRDPELRGTNGNVCAMRIASNERLKRPGTEEWYTHTNFVDVIAFGRDAERCATYLRTGSHVVVDAKLKHREFDDPQQPGKKRSVLELNVQNIQFMSRDGFEQPQPTPQYQQPQYQQQYQQPQPVPGMVPGMDPSQIQGAPVGAAPGQTYQVAQPIAPGQPQPVPMQAPPLAPGQIPPAAGPVAPAPLAPAPVAPAPVGAGSPVGAGQAGNGSIPW